jgi:hypothetical protein
VGHGVSGPLCDVGQATDELDGRPRLALPSRGGAVPRRAGPCFCPARRASVFAWAPEIPVADECREPGARTEQNGPTHGCESMLGRDDRGGSSLARASEVLRWTTAFAPDREVGARWRIAASHSSQAIMLAPWGSAHATGCSSRVSNERREGHGSRGRARGRSPPGPSAPTNPNTPPCSMVFQRRRGICTSTSS